VYRGEANVRFTDKYGAYVTRALAVAVIVHVSGALWAPPYEPQPYQLREKQTEVVNIPEDIQLAPPPKEIARPQLPQEIEASEDASEDETLAPTEFDPFEPPELPGQSEVAESFYAFDSPPEPVRQVPAEYPDLARQAEADGRVWIRVTIDETGRVINAEVERSEVIQSLERAAMTAARKWLFKPAKQRDVPVKCQIIIPFNFTLN